MRRVISSFSCLNIAQFLGALNDNVFKWVMIFLLLDIQGVAKSNLIISISGGVYVLPFLLFSIPAGTFADRMSKSRIIFWTKLAEVGVMLFAVWAFHTHSVVSIYAALFLMATQSALFSPSKYGIVREIVPLSSITRANGFLTALTVLSIIIGTLLASSLADLTGRNFSHIAWVCVAIAVAGTLATLGIQRTQPVGSHRKLSWFPFVEIGTVIKRARGESYLLEAFIGSAFFFFIGAFVQLNMVPFAIESLGLSDTQGGYLFFCSSLGIAIGAITAGKICGRFVELGIAPFAGMALAILLGLLYVFSDYLYVVIAIIFLLGLFAGLFLVPFDAFIQVVSPDKVRGQNLAVGNFLGFTGIFLASVALFVLGQVVHLSAAGGFALMGCLSSVVAITYGVRGTDTFVRLLGRWMLRKGYQAVGSINDEEPALLLCETADAWRALPLLSASHQRYMRFLIQRPTLPLSRQTALLCWLAKVRFYSDLKTEIKQATQWLNRGYLLTIIGEAPEAAVAAIAQTRSVSVRHMTVTIEQQCAPRLATSGPKNS
jgi:acyl-[acyl-carrier-protein]-phospholipid O-acyltransferase / long-chain-fatty-acid--[acyl-carrier-protein] ligase